LYVSTRLDADDGIARGGIAELQRMVRSALPNCNSGRMPKAPEFNVCFTAGYDWAPSKRLRGGRVDLEMDKSSCLSTALSVASCHSSLASTHLMGNHAFLLRTWKGKHTCIRHLVRGREWHKSLPVRARTVTSNGMNNVVSADDVRGDEESAKRGQRFLLDTYNISAEDLKATNSYLVRTERAVAAAQLGDRCNSGFSCKDDARKQLTAFAKAGRRLDAGQQCLMWQLTA